MIYSYPVVRKAAEVLSAKGAITVPGASWSRLNVVYADVDERRHKFTGEKLLLAVGTTPALQLWATVTDMANTMHVHPSIGEGLKLCAQGVSRDISLLSCCAE